MRFMTICLFAAAIGCGDDKNSNVDAPKQIDAAIDAPAVALTCANYCTTIAANCTTTNQQYDNTANCMASCMKFGVGTAADMSGNTLGCRIYHAGAAAGAPAVHCRHAGPGGDGMCGMNCEGFCTVVQGACSAQATPPFADMGACMTACALFPTTTPYSSMVTTGDTFACRMYHATVATTTPMPHCTHVVENGPGNAPCD